MFHGLISRVVRVTLVCYSEYTLKLELGSMEHFIKITTEKLLHKQIEMDEYLSNDIVVLGRSKEVLYIDICGLILI